MSQKTDPTSLRLQKTNKHYSSSWYSDYFYTQMNANDLQTHSYLGAISKQIAQLQMFPYIQRYYKRIYTYLFLIDTRHIRSQREKTLGPSHRGHRYTASTTASVAFLRSCSNFQRGILPLSLFDSKEKGKNAVCSYFCSDKNKGTSFCPKSYPFGCLKGKAIGKSAPSIYPVKSGVSGQNTHQQQDGLTELFDYAFNMWKHNQNQTRLISQKKLQLEEETSTAQLLKLMPYWHSCLYHPRALLFGTKKSTERKSLQELFSKLSFDQAFFTRFDFKCSILRDLIVQNRNNSKEHAKLLGYLAGKRVGKKTAVSNSLIQANTLAQRGLSGAQNNNALASNMFHETIEATLLLAYKRMRKAAVALAHPPNVFAFPSKPCCFSVFPFGEEERGSKLKKGRRAVLNSDSTFAIKNDAYNFQKKRLTDLTLTSVYPIRIVQDVQFAAFLAQEIVHLLQKGASFKQIQNRVLGECTKNEIIKGIRVSCSGRVGGRSKKAQKSKMQSVQWGETSLHVLSSRLSFASASASTPFGKVGIKLWLCYTQ